MSIRRKEITCKTCSISFCISDFRTDRPQAFCGAKCRQRFLNQQGRHPSYTNGFVNDRGYKMICVNGKPIYQHRHLVEQSIGRRLTRDEIVHHIDENPLNNSIENLQILTRSEHNTRHRKFYRDAAKKQCSRCLEIKGYEFFDKNKNKEDNATSWCKPCVSIYHKNR